MKKSMILILVFINGAIFDNVIAYRCLVVAEVNFYYLSRFLLLLISSFSSVNWGIVLCNWQSFVFLAHMISLSNYYKENFWSNTFENYCRSYKSYFIIIILLCVSSLNVNFNNRFVCCVAFVSKKQTARWCRKCADGKVWKSKENACAMLVFEIFFFK